MDTFSDEVWEIVGRQLGGMDAIPVWDGDGTVTLKVAKDACISGFDVLGAHKREGTVAFEALEPFSLPRTRAEALLHRLGVRKASILDSFLPKLQSVADGKEFLDLVTEFEKAIQGTGSWENLVVLDVQRLSRVLVPSRKHGGSTRDRMTAAKVTLPSVADALGSDTDLWVLDVPPSDEAPNMELLGRVGFAVFPPLDDLLRLCARPGDPGLVALRLLISGVRSNDYPASEVVATTVPFLRCLRLVYHPNDPRPLPLPDLGSPVPDEEVLQRPHDCLQRRSWLFPTLHPDVTDALGEDGVRLLSIPAEPNADQVFRFVSDP